MDSSKSVPIPVTLKGVNYLLWARTTKTNLCGRGLWNHIETQDKKVITNEDGKEISGDPSSEDGKWFQEDQGVLGLLQNSLEAAILEAYSYCETAKELWDTLKNVYGNVSNLSRVFEVKKAINNLSQEDLDFTKHFGKFRSLWAELEMLRPFSVDPSTLKERGEQDRVFGLLLTLNPAYNDLIKHILRAEKLPSLDEVCSQIQREQGSVGLFSGKGEMVMAHKVTFKSEDRKILVCDHCKKRGHIKDKCWILHPHLKPAKFKVQANYSQEASTEQAQAGPSRQGDELAMVAYSNDVVRKSDLEALIKSIAALTNKESGITHFASLPKSQNKTLIIDSGASHHMISNPNLINNVKPINGNVIIANGDRIPIRGVGDLKLCDKNSKAFFMPEFTSNLVSVKRATNDLNCYAIFGPNSFHFQDIESGKVLGEGNTNGDLYVFEDSPATKSTSLSCQSCYAVSPNKLWHDRLGHPHARALEIMLPHVVFNHMNCEACILGKHCKTVFPKSSTIYEKCFDLVHSDVWTAPCLSRDNNKYYVTFIDEKSKYTWVTLLASKDRVYDAFVNFQSYVTNQFNAKIKVFRSDNGGEYTSHKFKDHLAKHGIIHQTSCPYTPQQNGVAERKNRHLMEVARSMMFNTNVPRRFWSDAVMAACYLINRIPTRILTDLAPFEVLNRTKPSIDHLRVFGCICFVLRPGELRDKLEAKSTKCMFLGYSTTQKGYKCYDFSKNRTIVSRDVKFIEHQGYYDKKDWGSLKDLARSPSDRAASLQHLLSHLGNPPPRREEHSDNVETNQQGVETTEDQPNSELGNTHAAPNPMEETDTTEHTQPEPNPLDMEQDQDQDEDGMTEDVVQEDHHDEVRHEAETPPPPPPPPLRRSTRQRFGPEHWKVTRVYFNNQAVAHPIQAVCSLDLLPTAHQAFLGKIDAQWIPQSYEEAKRSNEWLGAVDNEVGAMERNHTWDEADLPLGKKAVSSRWLFTIKYLSNGDVERYKARLVARGFTQTYGDDYTETFAPVAKLHTVRVVLSLATNLDWELWQMDVKNAFLQGELEEEVYMTPPPGLEDSIAPGKVLRLRKAIYGLKQSPRAWYHKLSCTLEAKGFKRSEADHTLFTVQSPRGIVVVLVYVDDLIISGNDKEGILETKTYLKTVFDIKDLGELKYFLGIEVCRSSEGLFLSQRKYTLDLLNETGKIGAKPAKTPLADGYKVKRKGEKKGKELKEEDPLDKPYADPLQYRRLVGKLIYLTLTRPDLCFAVNQVSQYMQNPTVYHWNMVERILRYLKGSPGQGIWMGKNENAEIVGYCDADYAGDTNDRKSTTGYCTFIGGNLVTWKSKKQKVVSCSSAESEYRAMRKLTEELIWLKALLRDLGIETTRPITMHCDNQAAIHIASNSVFHERTKHIEVDCHKVREKIKEGVTLPCFTRSEDQLADIFTKAASLKVCKHIYSKLGLVDPTHP